MAALDTKHDASSQRRKDTRSRSRSPAAARSRSHSASRSRRSSHRRRDSSESHRRHHRSSRHNHSHRHSSDRDRDRDRHHRSSRRHHESSSSRRSQSRSHTRRRRSSSRDRSHVRESHRRHRRDSRDDSRRHRKHSDSSSDERRHRKRSRSASESRAAAAAATVKRAKDHASEHAADSSLSQQQLSVAAAADHQDSSVGQLPTAAPVVAVVNPSEPQALAAGTGAGEQTSGDTGTDPSGATSPVEASSSSSQSSTDVHVDPLAVASSARRLIDDAKAALAQTLASKQHTASAPATPVTPVSASVTPTPAASTVDVHSIKQDILKALAEARSTIAEIKGDAAVAPSPKRASPLPPPAAAAVAEAPAAVDEFDMFSMAELGDAALPTSPRMAALTVGGEAGLQSNCDDAEGYYTATVGEVLHGAYRVLGVVGKGVFSTVLRCARVAPTTDASSTVAIKLIRNNDVMRDAAQLEVRILNDLAARDPRDKKHCVRLLETFEHRSHVALVFEPMQMNVREAMKKFGGKGGIAIQAVRVFAKHLLIALHHLETCAIVHADIKPDNILLDAAQTTIKLCDFGSAFKVDAGAQDPTPYLVSRFYRAPEIVLGLPYDRAVDMWSVGCCLFEMFTGQVLFPGSTNNEMLKLFMELKGKVPTKLIKRHRQVYVEQLAMEPHFTDDLKFCSRETDRVTGKPILRLMDNVKAKNDLASSLLAAKSSTDDRKLVLELRSLLDRMFTLDPAKRISVRDALAHPFVKGG